jgi:hypothetical protein
MMTERSQHLKKFAFSIELFQDMFTQGWEIGTNSIVRCTQGLPGNAKFEYCEFSAGDHIILVFSHPTWPAVVDLDNIPMELILFTRVLIEESRR